MSCSRHHSSGSCELSSSQVAQFLSTGSQGSNGGKCVKRRLLLRILFCNQVTLQRAYGHLSASALKETTLPGDNLLYGPQSMLFSSTHQNAGLPASGSTVPTFLSQQGGSGGRHSPNLLSYFYLGSNLWFQGFLTHVQASTSHLDRKIFPNWENFL